MEKLPIDGSIDYKGVVEGIGELLSELSNDKSLLVSNLLYQGVPSKEDDSLATLVTKVRFIEKGESSGGSGIFKIGNISDFPPNEKVENQPNISVENYTDTKVGTKNFVSVDITNLGFKPEIFIFIMEPEAHLRRFIGFIKPLGMSFDFTLKGVQTSASVNVIRLFKYNECLVHENKVLLPTYYTPLDNETLLRYNTIYFAVGASSSGNGGGSSDSGYQIITKKYPPWYNAPTTGQWIDYAPKNTPLPCGESYGICVNGADAYLSGGYDTNIQYTPLKKMVVHESDTNLTIAKKDMPVGLFTHVMTDPYEGNIHLIGGSTTNSIGNGSTNWLSYNIDANTYTTMNNLSSVGYSFWARNSAVTIGEKCYICSTKFGPSGGGKGKICDLKLNTSTDLNLLADFNGDLYDGNVESIDGKTIYLIGPRYGNAPTAVDGDYKYDIATDTWTKINETSIRQGRFQNYLFVASTVFDGKIMLSGGVIDEYSSGNRTLLYDPVNNTSKEMSMLPSSQTRMGGMVTLNGIPFLFGGSEQGLTFFRDKRCFFVS